VSGDWWNLGVYFISYSGDAEAKTFSVRDKFLSITSTSTVSLSTSTKFLTPTSDILPIKASEEPFYSVLVFSFANHLSIHLPIPRFARSPYIRLLLPTSKINNHHSTIIYQTGLVIGGT